jgi:hypothetical protein
MSAEKEIISDPEIEETSSNQGDYRIRFYQPGDRATVRRICADTGFLSNPIDPLFEDRELFADYLTAYYTDVEPESTLVCEVGGEVKGYLMGCRHHRRKAIFDFFQNIRLGAIGAWRYFFRPYNAASRKFIAWVLSRGRKEVPVTPGAMPHFHINLLAEARNVANSRNLIETFLHYLHQNGEKSVYGQMVTYENRRGERMFARYGFKVIGQVEVTKYRELFAGKVFLLTVVKDLERNTALYGLDLKKTN